MNETLSPASSLPLWSFPLLSGSKCCFRTCCTAKDGTRDGFGSANHTSSSLEATDGSLGSTLAAANGFDAIKFLGAQSWIQSGPQNEFFIRFRVDAASSQALHRLHVIQTCCFPSKLVSLCHCEISPIGEKIDIVCHIRRCPRPASVPAGNFNRFCCRYHQKHIV